MGYQPVIDSYESWKRPDWASRIEVVAWGAGAEIVLRVKWMGQDVEEEWQAARRNKASTDEFDQHHHRLKWWKIKYPSHRDGHDDVTALQLLRDSQKPLSDSEYIVVGRASGELEMLSIDHQISDAWKREARFITEGQHIRSASVNSAEQPLLAACVSHHVVAIYPVAAEDSPIPPLGKIHLTQLNPSEGLSRAWFTTFLREDRLAISFGPSLEPIRVFEINPDTIPSHPFRTFSISEGGKARCATPIDIVYPLAPLPRSPFAGAADGDLFLSGGYDGTIR